MNRASVLGCSALRVGQYMPGTGASGAVLEHERLIEVTLQALAAAEVKSKDVGALLFSANAPPTLQRGFPPFFASRIGIRPDAQMLEVSSMGTTGGTAFDLAVNEVLLGHTDVALALGVHFETQATTREAMANGIRSVGDVDFQSIYGLTPIAWYGLDAARYLHEFPDVSRKHLASIAVKSREFSVNNPVAQYRDELDLEEVLHAPEVIAPLGLYDVPPRSDGVICVVVGREELATGAHRVDVLGRGFAHDGHHQMGRLPHSMTELPAAKQAVERALTMAGVSMKDIDVHELYAPCTITEAMVTESLGLFPEGEGAFAAAEGRTGPAGDVPVNSSGGCLARGHPVNVTGLYSILEVYEQLLGIAQDRQVTDASAGVALCELGNYNAALAHVLGRSDR